MSLLVQLAAQGLATAISDAEHFVKWTSIKKKKLRVTCLSDLVPAVWLCQFMYGFLYSVDTLQ